MRGASSRAVGGRTPRDLSKKLSVEVSSILVFTLAVFTLLSLISYDPGDPSFFSNSRAMVQNACGRVGALFSSALLQGFGLAAFVVPAALLFIAATIHKREGSLRVVGRMGGMTVAVIALTVFLTLQWKFWPYSGDLLMTGGAFGAWLSNLLIAQFNSVGSSIVALLVFCLAVALSTPMSVAQIGARVLSMMATYGWRITRLVGTYAAYAGGVLAMRVADHAGSWIQQRIRAALDRQREKKKKEDEDAEPVVAKPAELKSSETQSEDGILPPIEVPALPSEAENILASEDGEEDEEEEGEGEEDKEKPAAKKASAMPEILPFENAKAAEEAPSVPARTAKSRLSRMIGTKRGTWQLPTIEFLRKVPKVETSLDKDRLFKNSEILTKKFADFGIDGEVTAVRPGPVITLYEFKPGPGVKVSRIAAMSDDLSMALSAQSVRIIAPLPGKSVVGIEIPNETREKVFLREFLEPEFFGPKNQIPVVMGKDIGGQTYLSDLAKMPHLLVAGQTGAGKSVFMNGLICSLLYRFTPDEMRMILVDPKFIEFGLYQDIPHLLLPVVDDPKQASVALKWAVREMDRRYRILQMAEVRNLQAFNQRVQDMGADVMHDLLTGAENQQDSLPNITGGDWIAAFEPDENGEHKVGKLPYIVVIIDELADLMMLAKKEVEISIARVAQKARAAGIHLVIATQRPSTDVVTGLIKANLPSRLSFRLASFIDSKTILDGAGAERLLGQGDMLFVPPGGSQFIRLQGAFVDDDEIKKITSFLKGQGKPAYRNEILEDDEAEDAEDGDGGEDKDALWDEAVELARRTGLVSASSLQRHFKIGYNRAARMIETMEARGIVGPADGARPREVLQR